MRNLCIDIGNTRTKIAIFNNSEVIDYWSVDNGNDLKLSDNVKDIDGAILCTTVDVDKSLIDTFTQLPCNIKEILTWQTPIPVENCYSTPQSLGMDRLAAVIGAHAIKPDNDILVIDCGTAITYDFINASGQYLGGNISPGVALRFKSLHAFTAHLPLVSEKGELPSYGISTETAIRCGVIDGTKYEIEGFIKAMVVKYPNLLVFLTGGNEFDFDVSIKKRIFADKLLVPRGLDSILQYLTTTKTYSMISSTDVYHP